MKIRLVLTVELDVDEEAGTFEGTSDVRTSCPRQRDVREWEPLLYATAAEAMAEKLRLRAEEAG